MTHKPLNPLLKKIAIILTTLVLVGCATNKSSGVTSATSGTVDTPLPPISELTLDASLNDIPPEIRTAANGFFSIPIQASDSTGEMGAISHSTTSNGDTSQSIETLIVEVMEVINNRPVYRIDYEHFDENEHSAPVSGLTITSTALPISNIQHVTPPPRNGMNLKLTAIDYDLIGGAAGAGDTTIDGNFYFEIYTNYGETSGDTTFDKDNYLTMGNWLFIPADRAATADYSIGSFVNGAGIVPAGDILDITETATYTGAAYGFAILYNNAGTGTEAIPLSAEVRLNAGFDTSSTRGIGGTINNFNIRSGSAASSITSVSGQINLVNDGISTARAGGFGSGGSGRGGNAELVFTTSSGGTRTHDYTTLIWNSNFYGHNEGGQPDRVGGTIIGRSGGSASAESSLLNLGFGAYKDSE